MEGYIKVNRKVFDHYLFNEKRKYSRFEAWIDLMQMACYSDNKTLIVDNKTFHLTKGQLIASRRFLEQRWSWSSSKVKKFLDDLKTNHLVNQEKNQGITVLTLCESSVYSDRVNEKEPAKKPAKEPAKNQQRTSKEPAKNQQRTETNKVKKVKKVKESKIEGSPQKSQLIILDEKSILEKLKNQFPDKKVTEEIEKMKDWLKSNGKQKKDYVAFARNWLRKSNDKYKNGVVVNGSKPFSNRDLYRPEGNKIL